MLFALETYCPATDGDRRRGSRRRSSSRPRARRSSRSSRAKSSWSPTSTDRRTASGQDVPTDRGRDRPPRDVPDDAGGPPVREAGAGPVPRGAHQGPSHLALGQEAVAAGFAAALRPEDLVFCTYRTCTRCGGAPMAALMAELMGRATGSAAARAGRCTSPTSRTARWAPTRSSGRTCRSRPAPRGRAGAGTGQVVVCFFGDGTTNIGAFHEALNMAVVWRLPVVYVCENNLYMEYTPIGQVTAVATPPPTGRPPTGSSHHRGRERRRRGARDASGSSIGPARGGGPALVEAKTYRHGGIRAPTPRSTAPTTR